MKFASLALLLSAITYASGACPFILADNVPCYELSPDYCYCFAFVTGTWAEATVTCRTNSDLDARLLSIESAAEQALIEEHLRVTPGLSLLDYFWTSGSDSQVEGSWFWTSTGDFFQYVNFIEASFNNVTTNCLTLSQKDDYYWVPSDCTMVTNFICEGKPVGAP